MAIVWLVVLAVIASWLGYSIAVGTVFPAKIRARNKLTSTALHRFIRNNFFLLAIISSILVVSAISVISSVMVSVQIAVIILSFLAFSLVLYAYFMIQRFAGPMHRTDMVRSHPIYYPFITVICFLSIVSSTIAFGFWYLSFISIALWFVLGFICAEISIRSFIAESVSCGNEPDRKLAIFAINDAQHRTGLLDPNRYPFP